MFPFLSCQGAYRGQRETWADLGTRPKRGFSRLTSPSCEIPLKRVGDQSTGRSKVAWQHTNACCIVMISFLVFGPGSVLGTKGTCRRGCWKDLRSKLKPQQRFYVMALLVRPDLVLKSSLPLRLFVLNGLLVTEQLLAHTRICCLALLHFQNILILKTQTTWAGKRKDKERKDMQCLLTAASQFYPTRSLSAPVQCQESINKHQLL